MSSFHCDYVMNKLLSEKNCINCLILFIGSYFAVPEKITISDWVSQCYRKLLFYRNVASTILHFKGRAQQIGKQSKFPVSNMKMLHLAPLLADLVVIARVVLPQALTGRGQVDSCSPL